MPLMPVLEWATDLAAMSARFSASDEPMSGRLRAFPHRAAIAGPGGINAPPATRLPVLVEAFDRSGGQVGEVAAGAAFELLEETVRGPPSNHDFRTAGALERRYEIEHDRLHAVGAENFHRSDPFHVYHVIAR